MILAAAKTAEPQLRAVGLALIKLAEAGYGAIVLFDYETLLNPSAQVRAPLLEQAVVFLGFILARAETQTLTETLVMLDSLYYALGLFFHQPFRRRLLVRFLGIIAQRHQMQLGLRLLDGRRVKQLLPYFGELLLVYLLGRIVARHVMHLDRVGTLVRAFY